MAGSRARSLAPAPRPRATGLTVASRCSRGAYPAFRVEIMLKVALVTGSGRQRIGWHVAQALAERGYGLAIHYHTAALEAAETVQEFERHGVKAMAVAADVR